MFCRIIALLAVAASVVSAEMIPTSPDGATVAKIGDQLTTLWTKDTSGEWNNVTIQLMSGDNFQMIPVTTLQTGIDATTLSEYQFTVPDVSPTSKIYFLQFTPNTGNATQVTWTTRFTIAAADGSTTPPAQQTQPDGQAIPWGVGELAGGPVGAVGGAASESGVNSMSATQAGASMAVSSAASSASSSAAAVVSSASSSASEAVESAQSDMMPTSTRMSTTAARATTNTAQNASATPSTSAPANAAGRVQVVGMGVVGLVAGLVALAF